MAKRTDTTGPPAPEQAADLLLILDKEKALLSALAKTDPDGKIKTVPAKPEHNNDFLRLNGSDDWLRSFVANFFSQAKDPTRFSLIKLPDKQMEDPLVKRAMRDIEQGRITKDVVKFLKKYEVTPDKNQIINHQKSNEMAKQENQQPATVEQQEPPRYRYNEAAVDQKQIESMGLSVPWLKENGLYDKLMQGQTPDELVPIRTTVNGNLVRYQACISFRHNEEGMVILQTHPVRQVPDLGKPFLGHTFSEDDKINLVQTGYMGRVVPLRTRDGYEDCFINLHPKTNQLMAAKAAGANIYKEYGGVKLSQQEVNDLHDGKPVYVEGMKSTKPGSEDKEFSATLQYNACTRRVEYDFERNSKLQYGQELGKVPLTNKQVDDYNAGKAILVENFVKKNEEIDTFYIRRHPDTGKMEFSRRNQDNPAEVYVPNQINGVTIDAEERETLRKGGHIFLYDMTSRSGDDFSAYVKLNPETGYPMTSRTLEGFEERRAFRVPEKIADVTLSAQQRADIQDGKTVEIRGMKGYGGQEFTQWVKLNEQGTKLNYFNENPDLKREAAARNVSQTAAPRQDQKEERKKGRSQGVR